MEKLCFLQQHASPTVSQAETKTPNSGNGFGNATCRFGLMQTMGKGCWQSWTCAVKQAGDIALQIRRRWVHDSLLGWMVLMVLGCVGDVLMLSYFFDCAIDFKMLGSPKVILYPPPCSSSKEARKFDLKIDSDDWPALPLLSTSIAAILQETSLTHLTLNGTESDKGDGCLPRYD